MAAPFTSKHPSICSVIDIIRQGRCTLVSTIQMQQVLALNCLIAAFSLSALFLDGIRFSETQMTVAGILLSVASISFSYAKPVEALAPQRPLTSIFHPSISLSVLGQLLLHLACSVYVISLTKEYEVQEGATPGLTRGYEGRPVFKPSLLTTVVFLMEHAQQVSVMAVNYKGLPFMLPMTSNWPLLASLLACYGGAFLAACEVFPGLNEWLELVPLPGEPF